MTNGLVDQVHAEIQENQWFMFLQVTSHFSVVVSNLRQYTTETSLKKNEQQSLTILTDAHKQKYVAPGRTFSKRRERNV